MLSLPALTKVDGSNFLVSGGASLTLPGLASYAGGLGYTDTLQATGTGSVLSLPKLASITGETTNYYSFTQVQALAGGNVQLPALTRSAAGPSGWRATARAASSTSRPWPASRGWRTRQLLAPPGQQRRHHPRRQPHQLEPVNLPFDSTATLATAQIASFTGGHVSPSAAAC